MRVYLTWAPDHSLKGSSKVVTNDRYQCNSCYVPKLDTKPLVENTFVGNIPGQ